jgi:hypothetical protein
VLCYPFRVIIIAMTVRASQFQNLTNSMVQALPGTEQNPCYETRLFVSVIEPDTVPVHIFNVGFVTSTFILSSNLLLTLPSGLFPWSFPTKIFYIYFLLFRRLKCFSYINTSL